jgi:hypothetical protein
MPGRAKSANFKGSLVSSHRLNSVPLALLAGKRYRAYWLLFPVACLDRETTAS